MAKQIWKFGILTGILGCQKPDKAWLPLSFTHEIPMGGEIVRVAIQGNDAANPLPYFWCIVDPSQPKETRLFRAIWTGEDIPDRGTYRGTWEDPITLLVWHLFEIPREIVP